ncbi:PHP domain-containing protein [Mobilicoccus sp.]|uniref:PHP domain-containing protein n=1 Tax=Mobilicoccus sp. TaxID=2034349 RepID=UPI0028ADF208|nr:PHP domain-containing protein [Mobilicoccus sp.]
MIIDLHAHTLASDGTDTPAQLVAQADADGLDVVALTDHDTSAGWSEAIDAAERLGVGLLPGIEISCSWKGISVHLLGYLLDPADSALLAELEAARSSRDDRARRIVEKLAVDVPITWAQVEEQVGPGATIGRPHIADALVAADVVPDRTAAFDEYLYTGSPYYASHYAPDPVEAVRLVRAAGGVPVMAHPFAAKRGRLVPDSVIEDMARAGLFALEGDHPDHDAGQRAKAISLAADLGLFVTGSSDYHGSGKPWRLAACTTDPDVLDALLAEPTHRGIVRP